MTYDFAVIGSGVSGGRIAYELTRGGAKCILIEAGKAFDRESFPKNEMDYSTQMFWGGGLEVSRDARIGFLRARCLGGTSIVNQALLDRFDDVAFSDWRDRSGVDFLDKDALEPHYSACEATMKTGSIPEKHYNRNARIFSKAFDAKGLVWKPLYRAQGDCALDHGSDCIVCLGGCPRDAKQSSLVTTIRQALKSGLEVETEFEVDHIADQDGEVRIRGNQRGQEREIRAAKVVMAGGSFGNTAILLRSDLISKNLPALGAGFSCHPQYMTYAFFEDPVDAHKGALQSVKSDDPSLRISGYKYENVFAPPVATAMLVPGRGRKHQEYMRRYRHMASAEICLRDEAVGRIQVRKNKLVVTKSLTAQDKSRLQSGLTLVQELFDSVGAKEVLTCKQGFGLHLMGGCAIGTDAKHSVVDPEFRVHGHSRIFAADSSIFPSAPGINPSFTIMALSHKAAQEMLKS